MNPSYMYKLTTKQATGIVPAKVVFSLQKMLLIKNILAHDSALNNSNGLQGYDAIWGDGTASGTTSISSDIHVFGNVVNVESGILSENDQGLIGSTL